MEAQLNQLTILSVFDPPVGRYTYCSKSISIPPNHPATKLYREAPIAPTINPKIANRTGIAMSAKNASAVP